MNSMSQKLITLFLVTLFLAFSIYSPVLAASSLPSFAFTYSMPLSGNIHQGYLYGTDKGNGYAHVGIDIPCSLGATVKAVNSGTAKVGYDPKGYGNYVMIVGSSSTTLYAHLTSVAVSNDQGISAGTTIGYAGETGNANVVHVHFEVRFSTTYGDTINPEIALAQSKVYPKSSTYGVVRDSSFNTPIRSASISGLSKDSTLGFSTLKTYLMAEGYGDTPDVTRYNMNYATGQLNSGTVNLAYTHPSYWTYNRNGITLPAGGSYNIPDTFMASY